MIEDLTKYIERQQAKGHTEDEIKVNLIMHGWSLQHINNGFSVLLKNQDARKVWLSVIGAFLLVGIGLGAFQSPSITAMAVSSAPLDLLEPSCLGISEEGKMGALFRERVCCERVLATDNCLVEKETIVLNYGKDAFFSYEYACFDEKGALLVSSATFDKCYA